MSPKTVRNEKGQFQGKKLEEPAVFLSDFEEYVATMEPGQIKTKEKEGRKGKRIEFIDGKYTTADMEEYKFLKMKCEETKNENYGKIRCAHDPLKNKDEE